MKRYVTLATLVAAFSMTGPASAYDEPPGATHDITPVSLRFKKNYGEFGGEGIRITIAVKNVGTYPVISSHGGIQVAGITEPQAALYGPNPTGPGHILGTPIVAGATGYFIIDAPRGSLTHCQRAMVRIDTGRSLQYGSPYVFDNDSRVLTAEDTGAIRVCVGPIRP